MKKLNTLLFFLGFTIQLLNAQTFNQYFHDQTLRLDYIFAGDAQHSYIYLHQKTKTNHWYGRKHHLNTTPIRGQAQLRVYDSLSQKLIYIQSFGSLFQEWQTTPLAQKNTQSFEQSLFIPFPKQTTQIQIVFFDENHQEHIIAQNYINPKDILIKDHTQEAPPKYLTIHKAQVDCPIRVAFLAEGYTAQEGSLFIEKAQQAVQSFWKHQVFAQNKHRIEFIAIPLYSEKSGVSVPLQNQWKKSALGSHFSTFYSDRYLTTPQVHQMHQKIENAPYQHIIILANTAVYGGGGILNSYSLTTTLNKEFFPVVVHEFGHSFAGLADEYFYLDDVLQQNTPKTTEPWEKNITSLVDFESKWKEMVYPTTPIPTPKSSQYHQQLGAYLGLEGKGLYIPAQNCRMRTNDPVDFCPVCSQAIQEMIDYQTIQ